MGVAFLYLASILAGFALLNVPLESYLGPLDPILTFIGMSAVVLFSLVLIFKGLVALFDK
ncbi:hypothetical protein [Jeotgalibacillus soli]|uniref:Uncharacterized protein n=1 Tax=Jeotgalibacillus soli TaxID=889306 RepID=A0A0C2R1D0_9BACL|nr:hypothetical protein [Jeotgalibacillus soli]KIL44105.1 hypothetical protein KP78_30690 [Jeotgalibacillus soli]